MQHRTLGAKRGLPLSAIIMIAGAVVFFLVLIVLFFQVGDLADSILSTTHSLGSWSGSDAVTSTIEAGDTGAHYLRNANPGRVVMDQGPLHDKAAPISKEVGIREYANMWIVTSQAGVKVFTSPTENALVTDVLPLGTILTGDVVTTNSQHSGATVSWLQCTFPSTGWVIISRSVSERVFVHFVRPVDTLHDVPLEDKPLVAAPGSYCTNTSHYLPQTDYQGGDLTVAQSPGLRNPVHVDSVAECCTVCGNTQNCAYWTHSAEGDCWLKSRAAAMLNTGSGGKKLISGAAPPSNVVSAGKVQNIASAGGKANDPAPVLTTTTHCCSNSPSEAAEAFDTNQWPASSPLYYRDPSDSPAEGVAQQERIRKLENEPLVVLQPVPVLDLRAALDAVLLTQASPTEQRRPEAGPGSKDSAESARLTAQSTNTGTTLLQRDKLTADWTEQQAVGNGVFGALVGGNIRAEIIPVSIAGLYVKKVVSEADVVAKRPVTDAAFREARAAFKQHNYAEADKKISSYIKQNLGAFQYVADIALVYSPVPINWREVLPTPAVVAPVVAVKGAKRQPLRRNLPRPNLQQGRANLLHSMYDHLTYEHPNSDSNAAPAPPTHPAEPSADSDRPPFGDVLVSDGILDMKHGVAYTSIVEAPRQYTESPGSPHFTNAGAAKPQPQPKPKQSSDVRLHQREWYVSAVDKVMVGAIRCRANGATDGDGPVGAAGEGSQPCLNVALRLHRDNDRDLVPLVTTISKTFALSDTQAQKWSRVAKGIIAYSFELRLSSTQETSLPATVMSGVVICSSSTVAGFQLHPHPESSDPVLVCNNADFMHVVMSVESEGNTFDSPTIPEPTSFASGNLPSVLSSLAETAWNRVVCALNKGPTALKLDHMRQFASLMGRVDLALGAGPAVRTTTQHSQEHYTCASNNLQRRIESFTTGCLGNSLQVQAADIAHGGGNTIDVRLAGSLFHYGRYLLVSSATGAVANLQGIWADGPTAAWNGDYHLNINLQMNYWAADAVRLKEAMKPLGNFIAQLSSKGEITAKAMYGCQDGWVAHGFTDGDMDTSLYGDNQWALCVTCGAWAALSIWEHLITQQVTLSALVNVIDTLRGVVQFFKEYMYREDVSAEASSRTGGYMMHTGPTTSPENSYIILLTGQSEAGDAGEPSAHADAPAPDHPQDPFYAGAGAGAGGAAQNRHPPLFRPPAPAGRVPTKPYSVHHLTWSPAIDISVLRQVANAFTLSVEWALAAAVKLGKEESLESDQISELLESLFEDSTLASEFVEMVSHMPGGALPVIDDTMYAAHHQLHIQAAKASADATAAANAKAPPQAAPTIALAKQEVAPNSAERVTKKRWCAAGTGGCVREFPYIISAAHGAARPTRDGADTVEHTPNGPSEQPVVSEMLDIGHRHFSGMHWVYPNTFYEYRPEHYVGAFNSMAAKAANGGGHTGWSAVWEASLWARLKKPDRVFEALTKFVTKFLSPNLQSMHPPLVSKSEVDCGTCFGENMQLNIARSQRKERNIQEIRQQHMRIKEAGAGTAPLMSHKDLQFMKDVTLLPRGMVTGDQSKFQIDGNLGYLASMCELLVHSHTAGSLALLPALPSAFAAQGHAYGLQARGDVLVSMEWAEGKLVAAQLVFQSAHPWHMALQDQPQGFFRSAQETDTATMLLSAPNTLATATPLNKTASKTCNLEFAAGAIEWTGAAAHGIVFGGRDKVGAFPCVLFLCGAYVDDKRCRSAHKSIVLHGSSAVSDF